LEFIESKIGEKIYLNSQKVVNLFSGDRSSIQSEEFKCEYEFCLIACFMKRVNRCGRCIRQLPDAVTIEAIYWRLISYESGLLLENLFIKSIAMTYVIIQKPKNENK